MQIVALIIPHFRWNTAQRPTECAPGGLQMYKFGSLGTAHGSMKQASEGAALHEPSTGMVEAETKLNEALRSFCRDGWSASQVDNHSYCST